MVYYPVFLDLRGQRVLVAGAGKVALRKVRGLLEAGAAVTVVSPEGEAEFESLEVDWLRRRFRTGDVRDQALVFAATNDREVNAKVAAAAKSRGIPVNVADSAEECTFHVPARARKEGVQVAVSTGGRDPKQAAAVRDRIAAML